MRLVQAEFGTQICGDLSAGAAREWLVTDGLGGYAMGTVSGLRTRRYHGLLVVAHPAPPRRIMALAALDPVVILPGGACVGLGTHEWASGAVDPSGYALLERFDLTDGVPRWRWRVGDVVVERELAIVRGRPAVAVVHRVLAGDAQLTVDALVTWRDMHGERYEADGLLVDPAADGCTVEDAYRVTGPGFVADGRWWRGVHHREEAARGLAPSEDLYRVGTFTAAPGQPLDVLAWAGDLAEPPPPAADVLAAARGRRFATSLARAADAFVVRGPDVVAGYPWFGAWSRDTMIAYEGLFLTSGRFDEGRELLRAYTETLDAGMLANTADTGRVEHNTADATLWLLHAVERHVTATGDTDLAAALAGPGGPLGDVVDEHLAGTRYGLRIDTDGLLTQGADGHALTWMDAVVEGVPATQRRGKAVELNALWVNGLGALAALRRRTGGDPHDLDRLRGRALDAFRARFPAPTGWLYDTVDPDDTALRPNQVLAYSLPYAPMPPDPGLLGVLGAALLTPLGLRTLDPRDPAYRGTHRGTPAERDSAYHQGTVWPWLLGPFVDACRAARVPTEGLISGLVAHLGEWGLGSVSETADGDAPHAATGCPFQAWSVAELHRIVQPAEPVAPAP